jgi:small subunit ribosomal protein S4
MKVKGPKVKLSRRLGIPLTPKASRVMGRKPYPPGLHGRHRRLGRVRMSDYKRQLLEKQKLSAQYNVTEQQLRNYFEKAIRRAQRTPDITSADVLVQLLETRLDAVVMRSGLARTIYAACQYVSHGHILVNGRRVNLPAYQVQVGDVVSVRPESRRISALTETLEGASPPPYLQLSRDDMSVRLVYLPRRDEIPALGELRLVLEYYSRR